MKMITASLKGLLILGCLSLAACEVGSAASTDDPADVSTETTAPEAAAMPVPATDSGAAFETDVLPGEALPGEVRDVIVDGRGFDDRANVPTPDPNAFPPTPAPGMDKPKKKGGPEGEGTPSEVTAMPTNPADAGDRVNWSISGSADIQADYQPTPPTATLIPMIAAPYRAPEPTPPSYTPAPFSRADRS